MLGFAVNLMTFWKTVIYALLYTPLTTTTNVLSHVSWAQMMFVFVIPSGIWLVIPFMTILYLGWALLKPPFLKKTKGDKQR